MNIQATASLRNVATIGLDASGKTALLESLLYLAGTLSRKGAVQTKKW